MNKLFVALLIAWIFVFGLPGLSNAEMWTSGDEYLNVSKTVDPSAITPDGTAKVTLKVTWAVEIIHIPVPADVVLAIDSSTSMEWNDPNSNRTKASKIFVDRMEEEMKEGEGVRYLVGLVSWDDKLDFSESLTSDFDYIKKRIDDVNHEGYTNLNVGLSESIKLLDSRKPNVTQAVVFLTDGKQTKEAGPFDRSIVEEAKKKGYKIYTIGLGTDIDEDLLKWIADETGGEYRKAQDSGVLIPIYEEFAEKILTTTTTKIRDIVITDVLHNYLKVKNNTFSVHPTKGPIQNPDGTTTIEWEEIDPKTGKWESSFDVMCDFSNLPVDVNQTYRDQTHRTNGISIVSYTVEGISGKKQLPIPSGELSIRCPPEKSAILVPTSIELSPPEPKVGDNVTITARIKNQGEDDADAFDIKFYVNDKIVGTERAKGGLKAGEETRLSVVARITEKGISIINVKVDGGYSKSKEISIEEAFTPQSTPAPTAEVTPASTSKEPGFEALFAIAGLLAVAYMVLRRKRK